MVIGLKVIVTDLDHITVIVGEGLVDGDDEGGDDDNRSCDGNDDGMVRKAVVDIDAVRAVYFETTVNGDLVGTARVVGTNVKVASILVII